MISQWWSWALALTGCVGFWLVGSGKRWGWAVNIGVQVLWITYAIVTKQWGFVLGSIFYGAVFFRNLREAYRKDDEQKRREIAYAHRGEVVPGSGRPVEPRDFAN